jgi:hypothetical protein
MAIRKIFYTVVGFSLIFLVVTPNVFGQSLSQDDQNSIYDDTVWYKSAGSSFAGCINQSDTGDLTGSTLVWPFATKSSSQYNRVDQGWDIQSQAGAAIYAIASGTIHQYNPNPGGFGDDYPTEELDSSIGGPSIWVYYGHVHVLPGVVGNHVSAGQQIAVANTTDPENESAAPPGWLEIGFASPGTDAPIDTSSNYETAATPAGQIMKNLLISAQPLSGNSGSSTGCCITIGNSGGTTGIPTQSQIDIAKTIMGVVKSDHLGQSAALIALMAALDESSLQIYSNSNVPISLSNPTAMVVGSDHNSVGIFQQQPDQGWSTYATGSAALTNQSAVWQDMDPAFSTEAFLGTPQGATLPANLVNPGALTKGLQNVSDWQTLPPWVAAQEVQHSNYSDGRNYRQFLNQAQSFINQYWDSAQPVSLPIPIGGGSGSGGDSSGTSC